MNTDCGMALSDTGKSCSPGTATAAADVGYAVPRLEPHPPCMRTEGCVGPVWAIAGRLAGPRGVAQTARRRPLTRPAPQCLLSPSSAACGRRRMGLALAQITARPGEVELRRGREPVDRRSCAQARTENPNPIHLNKAGRGRAACHTSHPSSPPVRPPPRAFSTPT